MDDEAIKAALDEVHAAWLMDESDEFCQSNAIRHVVAAAVAAERERMKADAAAWGNALNEASWAQLDAYRKHMGQTESVLYFNMGKSILRDAIAAYFKALEA